MEIEDIIKFLDEKKAKISKKRDELRGVLSEIETLILDVQEGEEELTSAIRSIEDAADALSRSR